MGMYSESKMLLLVQTASKGYKKEYIKCDSGTFLVGVIRNLPANVRDTHLEPCSSTQEATAMRCLCTTREYLQPATTRKSLHAAVKPSTAKNKQINVTLSKQLEIYGPDNK